MPLQLFYIQLLILFCILQGNLLCLVFPPYSPNPSRVPLLQVPPLLVPPSWVPHSPWVPPLRRLQLGLHELNLTQHLSCCRKCLFHFQSRMTLDWQALVYCHKTARYLSRKLFYIQLLIGFCILQGNLLCPFLPSYSPNPSQVPLLQVPPLLVPPSCPPLRRLHLGLHELNLTQRLSCCRKCLFLLE